MTAGQAFVAGAVALVVLIALWKLLIGPWLDKQGRPGDIP